LDVSQTTVSRNNTNLVINWALTPKTSFQGNKRLFLYCKDTPGAVDNWEQLGTWNITDGSFTIFNRFPVPSTKRF